MLKKFCDLNIEVCIFFFFFLFSFLFSFLFFFIISLLNEFIIINTV